MKWFVFLGRMFFGVSTGYLIPGGEPALIMSIVGMVIFLSVQAND